MSGTTFLGNSCFVSDVHLPALSLVELCVSSALEVFLRTSLLPMLSLFNGMFVSLIRTFY